MAADATPTPPTMSGRDGRAAISGKSLRAAAGHMARDWIADTLAGSAPGVVAAISGPARTTAEATADEAAPTAERPRKGDTVPGLEAATVSTGRPARSPAAPA